MAQLVKESACNSGDLGSIPGSGTSPEEGKGYPLQYSGLENSMDCIAHRVAKSQTRLSNFHFHFSLVSQTLKNPPAVQETWVQSLGWEDPLEEGMATHSSIPAWRSPWTEEPGGLQSMGSQRVRCGWATKHNWGLRKKNCRFPAPDNCEISARGGVGGEECTVYCMALEKSA